MEVGTSTGAQLPEGAAALASAEPAAPESSEAGMEQAQRAVPSQSEGDPKIQTEEAAPPPPRTRTDRQVAGWLQDAAAMEKEYGGFQVRREMQNPKFRGLIQAGVPMRQAYESLHLVEIKRAVARQTARETERRVVDGIRARGARPSENGAASQTPVTTRTDLSRLTRQDRAAIAKRVSRGEKITF